LLMSAAILLAAFVVTVAVQRLPVPARGDVQSSPVDWRLRVVDEHDEPVAHFEAMTYSADKPNTIWWPGNAGSVTIYKPTSPDARLIDVLVRADGYASTISRFLGEQCNQLRRGEAKIVMHQGQPIELRFRLPDGLAWPTGLLPDVYLDDFRDGIWSSIHSQDNRRAYHGKPPDYNMFNIRASQPGRFALRLAPEMQPF
jgi:hypothetical protein